MTGADLKLNAGTAHTTQSQKLTWRVCCDVVNSVIRFFGQNERENKFFAKNLSIVLINPRVQAVNTTSVHWLP